jgi:predicted NAD/FAD-binding protein
MEQGAGLDIAIVGSGISGLSAAWLLSTRHRVTLFEADGRIGGHSHTVEAHGTPVDTGFIVYNERTYPNLTALFAHLGVPTRPTEMTLAISLDKGRLEYSGTGLGGLLAQKRNLVRPRFWSMMRDLVRFYREAKRDLPHLGDETIEAYLDRGRFGAAFRDDHLYPMAAAIWSTPAADIGAYPAAAFIRFCENHALLELGERPIWRTVDGGSRNYVTRLSAPFADRIVRDMPVRTIRRDAEGVDLLVGGAWRRFDHVIVATHADQALALLEDADPAERSLLGAFAYRRNEAVLHSDPRLMPRRRATWSSWNYMAEGSGPATSLSVTYWMNRLQGIPDSQPLFVTLNPLREPAAAHVIRRDSYEHPIFDGAAMAAQKHLWSLQGVRNTWYCGAHFGAGFHEDGLQAGLAVAEQLGGVRRPWTVAEESGRIHVTPAASRPRLVAA